MPPRTVAAAFTFALALLAGWHPPSAAAQEGRMLVIAHRGASGYLPEHTLAAKAMAHAQGAHCIEQDVVLTADGVPVVLHDIHLQATTDVAEVFPDRARSDGRWYVIDFTLEEIRLLTVTERRDPRTGKPAFPGRFPVSAARFFVPTLAEEFDLIEGLNKSTGRATCVYPEIKAPAFHRSEGQDISAVVVRFLQDRGYRGKDDPVWLQTFDAAELRRIREDLGWEGRLVQLIGENRWGLAPGTDFDMLRSKAGLAGLAAIADGIGAPVGRLVADGGQPTELAADAHAAGLRVHAYTVRADSLPKWAADMPALLDALEAAGVDGVFTDFPDIAVNHVR